MIIVKSIKEKPKECRGCRLLCEVTYDCAINPESIEYTTLEGQYEHCPIEELPDINVGSIDAISRTQAIDVFKTAAKGGASIEDIKLILAEMPSAQPERPKGKWIHQVKFSRVECDQCGKVFRNTFAPKNFCPNCGADMRGEQE